MPSDSHLLTEADVATIASFLGDVTAMSGSIEQRKRHLMRGVSDLAGADAWVWVLTVPDARTALPSSRGMLHEGLTDAQFDAWQAAAKVAVPKMPYFEPLTRLLRDGEHFTRTRRELVDDETWYGHQTVKRYRLDHGLDDFVNSVCPLDDPPAGSTVILHRRCGREPFSQRERRILHLVTANVGWLHHSVDRDAAAAERDPLSPRQRAVLTLLLQAKPRKAIARELNLSPHTVKDHTTAIYRHYGVGSHLELMRLFQTGGEAAP